MEKFAGSRPEKSPRIHLSYLLGKKFWQLDKQPLLINRLQHKMSVEYFPEYNVHKTAENIATSTQQQIKKGKQKIDEPNKKYIFEHKI